MAIKAGQILHVANQFVVDRLQTAGAGSLNIPTEKIFELGNKNSVAVVRDVPDLTFTLDSLDVSTEIEAILCGKNGDGDAARSVTPDAFGLDGTTGTKYDLGAYKPMDITSPMKSALDSFAAVKGVVVPNLALESVSYRYGLRDNAGESYSLRGDSIYYVPGHPYMEEFTGDGVLTDFSFTTGNLPASPNDKAIVYHEQGKPIYAVTVAVDGKRLLHGVDYTDTDKGITLTTAPANGAKIRVIYGSLKAKDYDLTVHQGPTVKPAAIKGKDIQVYIGTYDSGGGVMLPLFFNGVQSVNVDWRVTLEDDYEFGNPHAVARDFADVPAVSGSVEIKPTDLDDLFKKISLITGVPVGEITGPQSAVALPLEIRLLNPESGGIPKGTDVPGGTTGVDVYDYGTVLKTLYIPDARFSVPGYEGRVQQKLTQTLSFESDGGVLEVFRGLRF